MPKVNTGVLLTLEPALKEFVKHLDQQDPFILDKLDETPDRLIVQETHIGFIKAELRKLADRNTFEEPGAAGQDDDKAKSKGRGGKKKSKA